jgi:hypothetical protein
MNMPSELVGPDFYCGYEIVDVRSVDENWLLNSPFLTDNVLAILANHRDRRETIRRILARIATLEGGAREAVFVKLLMLAGLRKCRDSVLTEEERMPIIVDSTMDPELGPAIQIWLKEGEVNVLRRMIAKRFGNLPSWVEKRLMDLSTAELEELSLRFLDTKSLDELFGR